MVSYWSCDERFLEMRQEEDKELRVQTQVWYTDVHAQSPECISHIE